ncbi:Histamine receptor H3, partial [Caligus rogercresseyi]
MDSNYWRDNEYGRYSEYRPGTIQNYDYANWGYIILYILVIIFSLFGNLVFIMTVKRNEGLHRTPHFLLVCLAIRDLIVTLGVIPFVIDSQ